MSGYDPEFLGEQFKIDIPWIHYDVFVDVLKRDELRATRNFKTRKRGRSMKREKSSPTFSGGQSRKSFSSKRGLSAAADKQQDR